MKPRIQPAAILLAATFACVARQANGQTAAAIAAFNAYTATVESRLSEQHGSAARSAGSTTGPCSVPVIERLTPSGAIPLPGALLHDWRGSAFVPGVTVGDMERLLEDFARYPQYFAPQVLQASIVSGQGDHLQASMRVSQRHIIPVVMDSTYDVTFGRAGARLGFSRSQSTFISEIESPGTRKEHALSAAEEHGFLWRLNTYWTYEERDGGLLMQIESVSLTRSIPTGLGWAVRPFVETIPRDSLEFTLASASRALRK